MEFRQIRQKISAWSAKNFCSKSDKNDWNLYFQEKSFNSYIFSEINKLILTNLLKKNQTSEYFPLKLQKRIEEKISSKTHCFLKVLWHMERSFDHNAEFFSPRAGKFFTAFKKQKNVKKREIRLKVPWTLQKAVPKKLPEKASPKVQKIMHDLRQKFWKNHSFKKLRVKSVLCTCSMQFSQPDRDFLTAVWKIPARKPKLKVETRLIFRNCIIPQRVALKMYNAVLTTLLDSFWLKSENNKENWFFLNNIPSI